ncbi:MAG: response regulator transcription factor [Acidobacteria bacterium]|nr:response regulator transcription factor [Acidobacteriota bacterium]
MAPSPIRVFVLDDHTLLRESVVAALEAEKSFTVVGQESIVDQAKTALGQNKPDILLLEMALPGQSGFALLGEMASLSPATKTIVLGSQEVKEDIVEIMRLGARGFLSKQSSVDLFFKCIRKVNEGEIWLNSRLTEAVLRALGGHRNAQLEEGKNRLSQREVEVVQLVIQGYKNRDIAQKLFISEKTVKNHLSAIFHKLGVNDRLELTLHVFEKRLFPAAIE